MMDLSSLSLIGLVPHTFIGFVIVLLFLKVFTKIRAHFQVAVNCWFCNQNTRVPYLKKNTWDCPHCGQYNGFTADGDYNREISGQFSNNNLRYSRQGNVSGGQQRQGNNGFCQTCNDNQNAKVEKLATFEPKNEKTYDEEIEKYELTLQETYRLCHRCEKNLSRILADKKKMILGLHLAHKGVTQNSDRSQEFIKPSHIYTSSTVKMLKQCTSTILFILAIANWTSVIDQLRLNRENLQTTFGPITASFLVVVISHLAAITKVIMKYFSSVLNVYLIEKVILFIRTISILVAYTVGLNLPKILSASSALLANTIPVASMFLTFGSHFWEGFKVTRKTYLLATWSAFNCLASDDFSAQQGVYKVLISMAILILSLPTFTRKKGLQHILDDTVNSFHRIPGDDYLSDQTNTLLYSTKSISKSLNISNSSSNDSFSPVSLGKSSCRKPLTSSVFNLCTTPVSAFRSYSTEHLQRDVANLSNRPAFNPSLKSVSLNAMNSTPLRSPLPVNDTMNSHIGCSTPKTFISCASAFTSRRSLLSPSHFGSAVGNGNYCAAYAEVPQPMSNIYGNGRDIAEKRKNFIFNNIVPHESVSRESSQSSGFESLASSTIQPQSERFYSFDNTVRSQDCLSAYSEPQHAFDMNTSKRTNSFLELPQSQPGLLQRSTNNMDFASGEHWVRNSPMDMRESFRAEYFADHAIDRTIKSNAFDLNGMNSFLPPVRKRYNLLGNLRNNLGSHEQLHVQT